MHLKLPLIYCLDIIHVFCWCIIEAFIGRRSIQNNIKACMLKIWQNMFTIIIQVFKCGLQDFIILSAYLGWNMVLQNLVEQPATIITWILQSWRTSYLGYMQKSMQYPAIMEMFSLELLIRALTGPLSMTQRYEWIVWLSIVNKYHLLILPHAQCNCVNK